MTTKSSVKIQLPSAQDLKKFLFLIPILFIILAMGVTYYVRDGQSNLDSLNDIARQQIYSQINSLIVNQLRQSQPFASEASISNQANAALNGVRATGKFNYNGQIVDVNAETLVLQTQYKRAFQSDDGQTYLGSIDPYYFFKIALNFYYSGTTGDGFKEINGQKVPWIYKELGPVGIAGSERPQFNIWMLAKMFGFYGITSSSSIGEQFKAVFYLPVIVAMLGVIPIYILVRRFSNDLFALMAALFSVVTSIYVSRSMAGNIGTNSYNVLFPLAIVCCVLLAYHSKSWRTYLYAALAGFLQGFYLWAWPSGWWLLLCVLGGIVAYGAFAVAHNVYVKRSLLFVDKTHIAPSILFFVFLVSTIIFGLLFTGTNPLVNIYAGANDGLKTIAYFDATNIWPNVYSTVAELNPAAFSEQMNSLGGTTLKQATGGLLFILALLGVLFLIVDGGKFSRTLKYSILGGGILWWIIYVTTDTFIPLTVNSRPLFLALLFLPVGVALLLRLKEIFDAKVLLAIILCNWIAGTMFMAFSGVRFVMLMAPAIAIGSCICLYYLYLLLKSSMLGSIGKTWSIVVSGGIMLVLFLALFMPMFDSARRMSENPGNVLFDDAWYDSMKPIQESNPDSIVTSWWDYGHFFHAIGNRSVTFDGGTQVTPQAHWVGRLLMENNISVATDILRMLDCGGNSAFEVMYAQGEGYADALHVTSVINQTFGKSKREKIAILETEGFGNVTQIMNVLACDKPVQNFVVTSADMVSKSGVWAHWGLWDFTKKYVLDNKGTKSNAQIADDIGANITLVNKYVNDLNQISRDARNKNIKETDLINQWLAPYPSFIPVENGYVVDCVRDNTSIKCDNTVVINITTQKVTSSLNPNLQIARVLTISNNELLIAPVNPNGNVDVVILQDGGSYRSYLAYSPLGASLFGRLFFLDGAGLPMFKKVSDLNSITQGRIIVWETQWDQTSFELDK